MKTASVLDDLYTPVASYLKQVPSQILRIVESDNAMIHDITTHFFQTHGKMLRPAMTFLGAAAVCPQPSESINARLLRLAASFEIFHAATLIHDDIIDHAEIRRGIAAVNAKWGAQTAVLAGDFLHDRALITIFENGGPDVMRLFLNTAGIVCDGEIHELARVRHYDLTEEEYLEIIYKKTGSLLVCVLEAGARVAGGTIDQVTALAEFGRNFGNAFQIIDDCLDFTANQKEFGKTLGTDLAAGVMTLPLIFLMRSKPELRSRIIGLIEQSASPDALSQLTELLTQHGAIEYALNCARHYSSQALQSLELLPENAARHSLEKLAGYILERTK